ncbi:MAG: IclR family transcriptional regulator [Syntrophorhabdus sp.]|jgi:IclR family KDG regulon transcriptional repressor|nr:IclR family transcriptional regulator [Pseudomonadota bacterium]
MRSMYGTKMVNRMSPAFKRVPAIDKCFAILDLLARSKEPLGVSDIASRLGLNKSTVFNIGHTLDDLKVIENQGDGKYIFGTRFYVLSNMAGGRSPFMKTVHPYLEIINEKTKLSAFLGVRSDRRAILIDKVDSAYGVKVSSEIGTQMPVLAGAGIKAMLSQLSDEQIDEILDRTELKRFTPYSIVDKRAYKNEILQVRKDGIAYDREEYIEGMVAFGIPIRAYGKNVQAAIWAVGLSSQITKDSLSGITELLGGIREEINCRIR